MAKKGVDNSAFMNQKTILSAVFGSQCGFIGENAFKECESLSQINDNNVIESIGSNAFAGTKLPSAKFSILSTLYAGAFNNCSELSHIDIPNCISIPMDAFHGCISLKEIELLKAQSIGMTAFAECTSLTYINIPNCNRIGQEAFRSCPNLKSVNNKGTGIIIDHYAFMSCSNLSDIYFENCIEIGNGAFAHCESLNKINLNQCKNIDAYAFSGCTNMTQLTLSTCSKIGSYAFMDCPNLSKVYINNPPSIFCKLMSKYVFCNHNNNTSDTTHSNITFYFRADSFDTYKSDSNWKHYIDNMVMMAENNQIIYTTIDNKKIEVKNDDTNPIISNQYFTNYGLIEFKNKIVSLNQKIFSGSETLTSIDLPSECESIGAYEFENCKNLNNITSSPTLSHIDDYAFKNCESFKSFEIPNSITKLGEGVFAGCNNIERFEGKFATYGGKAVVYNNKLICVLPKDNSETEGRIHNISNIDINISHLGESCFYGCTNMRRIDIPSNIYGINNSAFEGCENLCEVHLKGNMIPTLGENVFEGVRSDFKIFVPESNLSSYYESWKLDNIYPKADNNSIIYYSNNEDSQPTINLSCPNGKYFKIQYTSDTLTKTFSTREEITKVILGENIIKIGEKAFKDCKNLEYIYLADNITQLQNECFCGCEKLSRIHISIGLKTASNSIGNNVFYGCTNLKEFGTYYKNRTSSDNRCYIDSVNTLSFFAQGGVDGEYTIPNYVTKIHKYAFRGSNITKIKLNTSTTDIGDFAFSDCVKLQSIENWDYVKNISSYAFRNCPMLNKISLPSKLVTIASHAFDGCKDMYINTNIPQSVNFIGEYAFFGCTNFKCVGDNMEEVALDLGSISNINKSTFEKCKILGKVNINEKIEIIGDSAFSECINLSTVSIPRNTLLSSINNNAFYKCGNLTDLYFPQSLQYIGNSAFENCTKYKGGSFLFSMEDNQKIYNLSIQKNINRIGSSCFKNSGVEELHVVGLSDIPDNAFENCTNLKHIDINTALGIKTIGSYAFNGCTNLCSAPYNNGKLELPSSVNAIGDYAFNGCEKISSVTLPTYLKKMGDFCLATGIGSTKIHIPIQLDPPTFSISGTNSTESYPFGKFNDVTEASEIIPEIYINETCVNDYKNDIYWKKYIVRFKTIKEITIEDYIGGVVCDTNKFDSYVSNWEGAHITFTENIPTSWIGATISFRVYNINDILIPHPSGANVKWAFILTNAHATGNKPAAFEIASGINSSLNGTKDNLADHIIIEGIDGNSAVKYRGSEIGILNV